MQPAILWVHALAALLFGMHALAVWRRDGIAVPKAPFVAMLALTSAWALALAGLDHREIATRLAETARQLGLLVFMLTLLGAARRRRGARSVVALHGIIGTVLLAGAVLAITGSHAGSMIDVRAYEEAGLALRMMAAAGALVLVRHLQVTDEVRMRGGARFAILALGAMWGFDLLLSAGQWVAGAWPTSLALAQGLALIALLPILEIATRTGTAAVRLSRTIAFQALSVVAIALYVALGGFVTGLIDQFGGEQARIAQTAFVFGSAAALLTIGSTPWLRALAKVLVAKHLFAHRYDYRREWLRFTDTLGSPGADAPSLEQRVVQAMADLTDSPAGLLLARRAETLEPATGWKWTSSPEQASDGALAGRLQQSGRIIELDAIRTGDAPDEERAAVPGWIVAIPEAWAIVPLVHLGRMEGAIVLGRPPVDRALDWEDFDLLGAAGRQVASYLAEDRARAALVEGERFDEFNRRFAFILHDLKNLVSQMTLVARNAERHADNPEFRADMISTLKDSSDRMTALLARLSGRAGHPMSAEIEPIALLPLAERIARARRAQHSVEIDGDASAIALADVSALGTLIDHLVQNAIEASSPEQPITIRVSRHGDAAVIEVEDRGDGMSPAFVRDYLFKPFHSSKPNGFGIGAYEARRLAEAMAGTLSVTSGEGEGTRFRITLPAAPAATLERAA